MDNPTNPFLWKNIAILAVLVIVGYFLWQSPAMTYKAPAGASTNTDVGTKPDDSGSVMCTMEAKQCPDGSYVGRGGPRCEFAACPGTITPAPAPIPSTGTVGLGGSLGLPGVTIKPLEVVSDSRCPVNANCIWAGEFKLKASVSYVSSGREEVLTLGAPFKLTDALTITLTEVRPEARADSTISTSQYSFTFKVEKI